eukprot:Phypoly_transcript_06762.p1 GENE.Phypoly_transcript_06762~~Phypoly_transcript_06762.p1  ORF type:complete len:544 (+),score=67.77 Phypoly_transcript_06762:67-1698(+)
MDWTLRIWLTVLAACVVGAYDTGHHNDLTRNTLQLYGYNQNAQIIAGIANFFVDYFSFTPIPTETLPELNLMHFDNIFTLKNASNYWTQFTLNAKKAIQTAASNGDVLEFIMTIGGTLHSVQDFYTHSDWVDTHYRTECDCYRSETWIQTLHDIGGDYNTLIKQQAAVHSYSWGDCNEDSRNCFGGQLDHGDACGGINKDSYVRPYWEQSYGFAFSGSVEWVSNIHQWASEVNPNIVNEAMNYVPPTQEDIDDMNQLNSYAYTVSYAIKFYNEDGHWKGPGSGSLARFLPAQTKFSTSKSIYKSKYQDAKIHQRWVYPNVYDAPGVDQSQVIDVSTITQITTPYTGIEEFTPVVVRTVSVHGQEKKPVNPSYYASVQIDGMEFLEDVYINHASFSPHWTSIKFVNTTANPTVPIVYTLKDNKFPKGDEVVSVSPTGSDSLVLYFDVATHGLTGETFGIFDSISNTFTTKNPNQNVEVQLFITANKFYNCTQGLPQQYCPNEAYVSEGPFGECKGETIAAATKSQGFTYLFVAVSILGMLLGNL